VCRPLTRREVLRYGALVAATPLVRAGGWSPVRAFAATGARAVPMNLELVTLTESSAVITWFTGDPTSLDRFNRPTPVPANTRLYLGSSPLDLQLIVDRNDDTPYHYVEVTGLTPGAGYAFRAESNGLVAVPTAYNIPGQPTQPDPSLGGLFTTPMPPPGRFLFSMAWGNDLHIGEMTSGIAFNGLPPGYGSDPGQPPYTHVMAQAAVSESKARGASLMLLAGDLTSGGEPVNLDYAKATFDQFGQYRRDYYVTRGNHDVAHTGSSYQACRTVPGNPTYHDCLRDCFFPDGQTYFSFDRHGVHFTALDTNDVLSGFGAVPPAEIDWLRADLHAHSHMPTFVFGHHQVTDESRATTVGSPVGFTMNPTDATALQQASAMGSVVGWYAGHTHRNKRTIQPGLNTPFIELGAVKEYPGGYGLVRVFEGGYALNFYKTRAPMARAWSERSRGEYLNLYPYYTLGSLADRNFVVEADFSDAAKSIFGGAGASPTPSTVAAVPPVAAAGGGLPGTSGGDPAALAAVVGAVGVAGAIAGIRTARRED
jgi:Icc protein